MIDIHSHIIFGVDDGARSLDESKEMIRIAMEEGTKQMVATSHYEKEAFPYELKTYFEHLNLLNEWCVEEALDFKLLPGNEFFLEPNGLKELSDSKCLSINNTDYLLVEISNFLSLGKLNEMLDLIENMGYKIIIAHTERAKWVLEDFGVIRDWYDKGYKFQINATSILRKDYKENYKSAHRLLKTGMVHMIASDGHRKDRRKPKLKKAYDYVQSFYGTDAAELLFVNNPLNVTHGLTINGLIEYKYYKKYTVKKLFKSLKGVK